MYYHLLAGKSTNGLKGDAVRGTAGNTAPQNKHPPISPIATGRPGCVNHPQQRVVIGGALSTGTG